MYKLPLSEMLRIRRNYGDGGFNIKGLLTIKRILLNRHFTFISFSKD